jgi:hypothetical protein
MNITIVILLNWSLLYKKKKDRKNELHSPSETMILCSGTVACEEAVVSLIEVVPSQDADVILSGRVNMSASHNVVVFLCIGQLLMASVRCVYLT